MTASFVLLFILSYCDAAAVIMEVAWFSPQAQSPTADQTIIYQSPMCNAQGLDGASCVFSANLFSQKWNPSFSTWTSMVIQSGNGTPVANNTVTQLPEMQFLYQDAFGALSISSTAGNSADLDLTYSMFCVPTSLPKYPSLDGSSPWLFLPESQVVVMKQYATTHGFAEVLTEKYSTYVINFCFNAKATYTTVEIGIEAANKVSAMQSYLCVNSSSCIPEKGVTSDTSGGGYLSMTYRLDQGQYGPMAVIVEGLGRFDKINTFLLWARML